MNRDIQKELCFKYGTEYVPSDENFKIGLSKSIWEGEMPINGLRHTIEGQTCGWYIWSNEFSEDPDFFVPVHVKHLKDICPLIYKYLGLPPGYRFLIDDKGYEDIWKDEMLIK